MGKWWSRTGEQEYKYKLNYISLMEVQYRIHKITAATEVENLTMEMSYAEATEMHTVDVDYVLDYRIKAYHTFKVCRFVLLSVTDLSI